MRPASGCVLGDNEWCTPASPCFSCEEAAHAALHPGWDDPECPTCRLRSVQLSPAATPTKTRKIGPLGPKGDNSWERGIATDSRGMPLLKPDGNLIGVKEYGERRHVIEDARRANAQTPAPPAP